MADVPEDRRRRAIRLLLPAIAALAAAASVETSAATTAPPDWGEVLRVYLEDPLAGGDRVLSLAESSPSALPPSIQLALADVYLRQGRTRAARRMLMPLADTASAWSGFANLGLGMIGASGRELSDARARFAVAARFPGLIGYAATLAGAQVAAALGDPAAGRSLLEPLRVDSKAPRGIRRAAELTISLSLLQEGRTDEALARFDTLASSGDALGYDARYASAQALLRRGDPEGARTTLEALVEDCPPDAYGDRRHSLRALRRLQPRAVLRAWLRNYRRLPFMGTDSGAIFGIDGCSLARDQRAEWARENLPPSYERTDIEVRDAPAEVPSRGPSAKHRDGDSGSAQPTGSSPILVIVIVVIAAGVAAGLVRRNRRSRP